MIPNHIIQYIKTAKEENWKLLDLRFRSLEEFPLIILELENLEELDLFGNALESIPLEIKKLKKLKRLDVCCNPLEFLPPFDYYVLGFAQWDYLKIPGEWICEIWYIKPDVEELVKNIYYFNKIKELSLSDVDIKEIPSSIDYIKNLATLNLAHNKIERLPESIGNLVNLNFINLSENQLIDLPHTFGNLKNLTTLIINQNKIKSLPDSIKNLTSLTSLDISENELTEIPEWISKLKNLTTLTIKHNKIERLPESIGNLVNLSYINISENQLIDLLYTFGNLKNLTTLTINQNKIISLPDSIKNSTRLRSLDISKNELAEIPEWISNLENLHSFNVSGNKISSIPEFIVSMLNLKEFFIRNNPLSSPFRELIDKREFNYAFDMLPAFKEYFESRKLKVVKNNEMRLIFIGNSDVGKTSVIERIKDDIFREKPSTHGIQHTIWDNFFLSRNDVPELRLHIWDFAGQEFYHATHRFFLKTRALFFLIWSADNHEKTSHESGLESEFPLEYWLDKISGLSDYSPIIIIQNKTDSKKVILEKQKEYSEKYNVIEFINFSAKTGFNRNSLLELINEVFTKPELMGNEIGWELPVVWYHIKLDLETIGKVRNYISFSEFLELCSKEKLNLKSAKILCKFLHNLGTILYLGNYIDPESMVILNQVWSSKLVYKFIKNENFLKSEGRFNEKDISELIDFKSYSDVVPTDHIYHAR